MLQVPPFQTLPHKLNAPLSSSVELLCLRLYNELSFGLREIVVFRTMLHSFFPAFHMQNPCGCPAQHCSGSSASQQT